MVNVKSNSTFEQWLHRAAAAEAKSASERTRISSEQQIELIEKNRPETAPLESGLLLPKWPEATRGVPNTVLRSALFGSIKRGKRAYQYNVRKASIDGITVIHTGPQLDQADLDVFEYCLHLARIQGVGNEINFSSYSFLKAIGRSVGKANRDWLHSSIKRLQVSLVELKDGNLIYTGQLLGQALRNNETHQNVIVIHPLVAAMYGTGGWTQIEWKERHALKGHPLAQWLHGFYSTHEKPYAYKVETLLSLSGSEAKLLKSFKVKLKEALKALEDVTGWHCKVDEKNLVHVNRLASKRGIEGADKPKRQRKSAFIGV
jgi:hypothetical protein